MSCLAWRCELAFTRHTEMPRSVVKRCTPATRHQRSFNSSHCGERRPLLFACTIRKSSRFVLAPDRQSDCTCTCDKVSYHIARVRSVSKRVKISSVNRTYGWIQGRQTKFLIDVWMFFLEKMSTRYWHPHVKPSLLLCSPLPIRNLLCSVL